jgi:hypothetical protein
MAPGKSHLSADCLGVSLWGCNGLANGGVASVVRELRAAANAE